MSSRWEIHLSPEAAAFLRAQSRSTAASIAETLDRLAEGGRGAAVVDENGPNWTGHLLVGEHIVTVAGRAGDSRIVVVRIALADEPPALQAVDVLPLSQSTRRSLGMRLQGMDLDIRYTLRRLRRAPLFVAVVVTTLAVGFGGATALLDVVNTVYAAALPFGDGDRLVRVRNVNATGGGEPRRYNLTPADFNFIRDHGRVFDGVVAMGGRSMTLLGDGSSERISAVGVSAGWMDVMRIRPALGRDFSPDEARAGEGAAVGLISNALWQRRFAGDSAVIGSTVRFDGGALRVIGVMPPNFNYPYDAAVWTPALFAAGSSQSSSLNVVARLKDGSSLESARSDAARVHADRARASAQGSASGFDIATTRADLIREDARTVRALSVGVLFLLVLACVNVANLLVARFATRRVELGLRAALGGSREQQVRQMVFETVLLFVAGTAGGVVIASWIRGLLSSTIPETLRDQLGFNSSNVGWTVMVVGLALGLVAGIGAGIAAGMRAARTDPMTLIRLGGRTGGGGDRRLVDVLVAAQLSLSLVLLVGASLLIGRFRELSTRDPGYDLNGVLTMRVSVDAQERYRSAESRLRLARTIEERIAALPGVEAVGITSVNPLCCGDWGAPIEVEGAPLAPGVAPTLVGHSYVSPGYFRAMRIPLLAGSGFERTDSPGRTMTVVIDRALADMAWPGVDPIGKRIRIARPSQEWRTVTGVVPVTEHESEMRASWYLPYYQDPTGASAEHLHVMVRRSDAVTTEALRNVIGEIDPSLGVYGTTTMTSLQRERTAQDRLGAVVSAVFAAFGLILAGFSLYGLLSYSVELRKTELGIRVALGASRGSIVGLVMREATGRLLIGTAAGIALSFAANQALRAAVAGLGWVPWQTLTALAVLMGAVTVAAAAGPALRATRVDPIKSLRG